MELLLSLYIKIMRVCSFCLQADVFLLGPVNKRPQSVRRRGEVVLPVRAVQVTLNLAFLFSFFMDVPRRKVNFTRAIICVALFLEVVENFHRKFIRELHSNNAITIYSKHMLAGR